MSVTCPNNKSLISHQFFNEFDFVYHLATTSDISNHNQLLHFIVLTRKYLVFFLYEFAKFTECRLSF